MRVNIAHGAAPSRMTKSLREYDGVRLRDGPATRPRALSRGRRPCQPSALQLFPVTYLRVALPTSWVIRDGPLPSNWMSSELVTTSGSKKRSL